MTPLPVPPHTAYHEGYEDGYKAGRSFERKEQRRRAAKAFTPPSLADVMAYCRERNRGIDPQLWYDHYQANGWMVGKVKMKDWRAAVRTWERQRVGANGQDDSLAKARAQREQHQKEEARRREEEKANGAHVPLGELAKKLKESVK